ncbi:glycosyltransferase [Croceivirga sp. JEA036]|uniref:glycosyltransferase n=1 Tax=Croceivirga sp. JEA036 TaxID=2721162 RepID=UPI00143B582E|nr:glycosyltransferase [Croceivirga sp. JEA036]NJB35363.1 glycosyltransferase [Croceivirga sp. JEA036]
MNFSILIYSLRGGGAERVVSYLVPYIQSKGYNVHLVLMHNTLDYELPKSVNLHFIENSHPNENGILKLFKLPYLAYKYAKLLKTLKITHSFSLLTRPNYINVLSRIFSRRKFKLIISERNFISEQYGYGNLPCKINKWLVKKLYPKADLIICNAKASGTDLVNNYGVSKTKIKTIYNPIDLERINSIKPISDFFNKDYINLISVGRLQEVKNHSLLISSIKKFNHIRLYILGEGHLREKLEQQIAENNQENQVFLLGFDSNPYKYLKAADLFIFGSNHEGFPNVLLESLACKLPILTTNCKSGPNEILLPEEETEKDIMITPYGILTPVKDVALMQKGLNYFLDNPDYLKKCKENTSVRIQNFKKEEIIDRYLQIIKSV